MDGSNQYFGKYRGSVLDNIDPQQNGRLMAMVPDVLGVTPSSWAMPCVPFGGLLTGAVAVPAIGAGVWIEFEQGDINYPIWTGCFWGGAEELPPLAKTLVPGLSSFLVQTTLENGILVTDAPGPAGPSGGILLQTAGGAASIMINEIGITIMFGASSIVVSAAGVAINDTALVILP
jgi:hypothetical protein